MIIRRRGLVPSAGSGDRVKRQGKNGGHDEVDDQGVERGVARDREAVERAVSACNDAPRRPVPLPTAIR